MGSIAKTDIEKKIIGATYDKKIKHYQTKTDYTNLIKVVTKWRIMLGLSKEMSEEELKINLQFIKNSYGNITLKELNLAIDLSLEGKLETDVEPYGNFSPLYISRILNAFLQFHNQKVNELIQREKRIQEYQRQQVKELTYEEKVEECIKFIKGFSRLVKESNRYYGDYNHVIWNFLNNNGLIDPDDELLLKADEFAQNEILKDRENDVKKVLSKMKIHDKKLEMKRRKEMYGRFYVMRNFFRNLEGSVDELIQKYSAQNILPKPKSNG